MEDLTADMEDFDEHTGVTEEDIVKVCEFYDLSVVKGQDKCEGRKTWESRNSYKSLIAVLRHTRYLGPWK